MDVKTIVFGHVSKTQLNTRLHQTLGISPLWIFIEIPNDTWGDTLGILSSLNFQIGHVLLKCHYEMTFCRGFDMFLKSMLCTCNKSHGNKSSGSKMVLPDSSCSKTFYDTTSLPKIILLKWRI